MPTGGAAAVFRPGAWLQTAASRNASASGTLVPMPDDGGDAIRDARADVTRPRVTRLGAIGRVLVVGLVGVVGAVVVGAATTRPPSATIVTPAPASVTRLGFLTNGGVAGYQTLESFVARQTTFVVQNADYRSAHAFESSVWGEVADTGQFQTLNKRLTFVLSVPLTIGLGFHATTAQRAAALNATASGTSDPSIRYISQLLVKGGYPNAIIRLGWEFDGDWMPWSARRQRSAVGQGVQACSRRHAFGLAQLRVRLERRPGLPPTRDGGLSGRHYVDIIGYDVYDETPGIPWNPATSGWLDPQAAWTSFLPQLRWQRDFAIAHGKRVSYPEWALSGINANVTANVGGDDPAFIQGMYDWMNSLPPSGPGSLAYSSYFNADTDSQHRINGRDFPERVGALQDALRIERAFLTSLHNQHAAPDRVWRHELLRRSAGNEAP